MSVRRLLASGEELLVFLGVTLVVAVGVWNIGSWFLDPSSPILVFGVWIVALLAGNWVREKYREHYRDKYPEYPVGRDVSEP